MRRHLMLGWMLAELLGTGLQAADRPATTAPATTRPTDRLGTTAPAATRPTDRLVAIKRMLAELSAESPETREAARVALMGLKRQELPLLRRAVKESLPLDPDQVSVLRDIVTQVYLAGDIYPAEEDGGGFLGVHLPYSQRPEERSLMSIERGVAVVSRVPGFCSYRMLQDGDVLLAMETPHGKIEFSSNEELIDAVTGARAGETVTFEVLRQGRILSVPITLDKKPLNVIGQFEEFNGRRADEADELWRRDFAPLLAAQLG
jgi:hypothetical protein